MMTLTKTQLKTVLVDLYPNANDRRHSIEAWLVRMICNETGCDVQNRLEDIARYGCISGAVAPLIYYSDCVAFYTKFSPQIWQKIETFLDGTGQSLGDFLNGFSTPLDNEITFQTSLSWFAVEEAATRFLERAKVW